MELLEAKKTNISLEDVFSILRDHGDNNKNNWRPDKKIQEQMFVCMLVMDQLELVKLLARLFPISILKIL